MTLKDRELELQKQLKNIELIKLNTAGRKGYGKLSYSMKIAELKGRLLEVRDIIKTLEKLVIL